MGSEHRTAMIDRIERARFNTTMLGQGWDEREVDTFLSKIAKDLRDESPVNTAELHTASFTTTRPLYPGYVIADVQALLNQIARYTDELPRSGYEAMISRIQNSFFRTTRRGNGYNEDEVDTFLDGIVKNLSEGRLPDPAALRVTAFTRTQPLRSGYVTEDVHALLNEIEHDTADR
jgi:DivIVA domain-containing protein